MGVRLLFLKASRQGRAFSQCIMDTDSLYFAEFIAEDAIFGLFLSCLSFLSSVINLLPGEPKFPSLVS